MTSELLLRLAITVLIGAIGGVAANKAKLPAGAMTGSMILVMLYTLITEKGYFPIECKTYVQFFTGALIGVRIQKKDVIGMKTMVFPCIVLSVFMLILNMVFGILIHYMSGLDVCTSFFCSAPAGMSDMALIATDYGANGLYVSITQMMRIVIILSCMPTFYKFISTKRGEYHETDPSKQRLQNKRPDTSTLPKWLRLLITIAVAIGGGSLFRYLGIRSGALIGAIVTTSILSIYTDIAYFPKFFRTATRICAGAYVGALLTRDSLYVLKYLVIPVLIMLLGMFVFVYIFGIIMQKITGLDILTCLLIVTPGGSQEMALMASDFDCDVPKVVLMHVVRVMVVIFTFPPIFALMEQILP